MKRIRNLSLFALFALSVALILVFGYLCYVQALSFVEVPRYPAIITPQTATGILYETVSITTEDDLTLAGWYTPPTRPDGATFLYVHGHMANRTEFLNEHRVIEGEGYGGLFIDLRGHGTSDDAPVTMGVHEARDVQAAFAWLQAQPAVNPERIALYGHSMGAAAVLLAAPQLPEARVVIASAPYTSIRDALEVGIPQRTGLPAFIFPDVIIAFSNMLSGADFEQAAPINAVDDLTQPLFILHGTGDGTVPYQHGMQLYEAASVPKALYSVVGADHVDIFALDRDAYRTRILDFLAVHLIDS